MGVEVAKELNAPLDLLIPRKIGHQFNPEYAICAVSESGDLVCNEAERAAADPDWFEKEVQKEIQEAKRRRKIYLADREPISAEGKIIIIVDDGIATGLTMRAAIEGARRRNPEKIVVAIPVTPRDTAQIIREEADELVALDEPAMYLGAVGAYYREFGQTSDEEVLELMKHAP